MTSKQIDFLRKALVNEYARGFDAGKQKAYLEHEVSTRQENVLLDLEKIKETTK